MIGEKFLWGDFFSKKNEVDTTILATLKRNKLFQDLSKNELHYISKIVHVRNFESNELIFSQHEKALGMYMIAKGAVQIRLRSSVSDKVDPETLVTELYEGSFLGELALVDDSHSRSASAYAHGPTTLIGFFKPDLMELIERRPEMGVKILLSLSKVLGKRLLETIDQIGRERMLKK